MPAPKRPNVDAHPLVKALVPDPTQPPTPSVKIAGPPGDSPNSGATRVWLDEGLTAYVDVPKDSVLHSQVLADGGGTVLWVAHDATLTYGTVASQSAEAAFLSGQITSSHMAGAVPGGGATPTPITPRPSLVAPCASAAACQPSVHFLCPTPTVLHTHIAPCFSLPVCPSETMPASHCAPCPSIAGCTPSVAGAHCLFSIPVWACPPSRVDCPTFAHCSSPGLCNASLIHICPTPSALGRCGV